MVGAGHQRPERDQVNFFSARNNVFGARYSSSLRLLFAVIQSTDTEQINPYELIHRKCQYRHDDLDGACFCTAALFLATQRKEGSLNIL